MVFEEWNPVQAEFKFSRSILKKVFPRFFMTSMLFGLLFKVSLGSFRQDAQPSYL